MKKYLFILSVLFVAGLGMWHFVFAEKTDATQPFQLASVTRGNLTRTVSGTGTLGAVGTVDVGSQVSGTIAEIYVDYNDQVKQGQKLAVLDTSLLEASVRDAEASVNRSQAQLFQAQDDYNRNVTLHEKGLVSDKELIGVRTNLAAAKAALQSVESALVRAKTNLKNAKFYSPIDGRVIQRNVEVGQTVAASLQAPTLFVIAEDLAKMQILGLVDESDIGQIREGQMVHFTVQAYPDQTIDGRVRQIRLQPQTVQNVVNYTVVVDADNPKGLLLPGMTATVDFVVEHVENALLVPSAALRVQPTQAMIDEVQKVRDIQAQTEGQDRPRFPGVDTRIDRPANMGRLWVVDASGKVSVVRVKTGTTDGLLTAIVSDQVEEGMQVIKSVTTNNKTAVAASNPLLPQRNSGTRRPPF